jgi:hypothetical protein
MKYLLIISLLLFPTIAVAQDLNLKLTQTEADIVWKGLRKLPVEEVEALMQKIRQQAMDQITPKPLPNKEPEKK